jgi:hypothetical protein
MGDIIVSDYHKLSVIGRNGGCDPAAKGCDKDFSVTRQDRVKAVTGIYRGIESLAYQKLVPLVYHVHQLNTDPGKVPNPGVPPDPRTYECAYTFPFPDHPALGSTALLQEVDSTSRHNNRWETLVMADAEHLAKKPSDAFIKIVHRMFDPISASLDPMQGGLGISPTQLMTEAPHYGLYGYGPGEGRCSFQR